MEKPSLSRFIQSDDWKITHSEPAPYIFVDQAKYKEPSQQKELSNLTLLESIQHILLRCNLFQELIFDTSHLENIGELCKSVPSHRYSEIEPFISLFNLFAQGFSTNTKNQPVSPWVTEMQGCCKVGVVDDPVQALTGLFTSLVKSSRIYFAYMVSKHPVVAEVGYSESSIKEVYIPQLRKSILEGISKEFKTQQSSKDDSDLPDDSLILVQAASKRLAYAYGWDFSSPSAHTAKLYSVMEEMALNCNQDKLRSLFLETKFTEPRSINFNSPFLDDWSYPIHPALAHPFRRFNFSGNTSVGLFDLSSLKYTNEKNHLGVEVFRKVTRLKADGNRENKLHIFKCSLEFVKKIEIKGSKNEPLPKLDVPFELPLAGTVIKKVNEADTSCDYMGDYDVGIFYVGNASSFGHRWCQVNIDEHISALKDRQIGVHKVYVSLQNNNRIAQRKYLKVVYTQLLSEKDPNFEFKVYVPDDEYATFGDFIDYLEATYFKMGATEGDNKGVKLRGELLNSLRFSICPSIQSEYYAAIGHKDEPTITENTMLLEIFKLTQDLYNKKSPSKIIDESDDSCVLHCLIDSSEQQTTKLDWFKAEPNRQEHKPVIDLRMSLTNLVEYVLKHGEALKYYGTQQAQCPLQAQAFGHPVPRSMFLPGLLIIWTKYVNNMIEFTVPFDFKSAVSQGELGSGEFSSKYEVLGFVCKKKQATSASPPIYYPVVKVPGSNEVIGYVASKDVRQPMDKLKVEFIEGVILHRQSYDTFSI